MVVSTGGDPHHPNGPMTFTTLVYEREHDRKPRGRCRRLPAHQPFPRFVMTELQDLISRMADELDHYRQLLTDDCREVHPLAVEARAALAAAPEGEGPSLEEVEDLCEEHCFNVEGYESIECLQGLINDALTRWGRPAAPPAPLEGEVGELVAWMKSLEGASIWFEPGSPEDRNRNRAAGLLQQLSAAAPAVVPVAVSERLPEPNIKVLAHYFNVLGKGRTICAIWVPAKTRSDSYGDDDFTEYDEETDKFYWPEGWYEAIENWDDLGWVKVDEGEVVYWQPLPKWPAHTHPLPAPQGGEVEA
jgi:hypothetical protein